MEEEGGGALLRKSGRQDEDGTGQDEERYHRMERGQIIERMVVMTVKMMVAGTEMQHVFDG